MRRGWSAARVGPAKRPANAKPKPTTDTAANPKVSPGAHISRGKPPVSSDKTPNGMQAWPAAIESPYERSFEAQSWASRPQRRSARPRTCKSENPRNRRMNDTSGFAHAAGPAITLTGVNLTLGRGAARVHILKDIGLNIGRGEAIGMVGPSGSGKSTLLMVMAGLEHPTSGSVAVACPPLHTPT